MDVLPRPGQEAVAQEARQRAAAVDEDMRQRGEGGGGGQAHGRGPATGSVGLWGLQGPWGLGAVGLWARVFGGGLRPN